MNEFEEQVIINNQNIKALQKRLEQAEKAIEIMASLMERQSNALECVVNKVYKGG